MVPLSRPRITRAEIIRIAEAACKKDGINLSDYPVFGVGIRGYYTNSMGATGRNDRGIYDDAIAVVTPNGFVTFNANVDPSGYRKGKGTGRGKGVASLIAGAYAAWRLGLHRMRYTALVQRRPVTVQRDGNPPYHDTGNFGINIHRGAANSTSSLGCHTVYPTQWAGFIRLIKSELERAGQTWFLYVLHEEAA